MTCANCRALRARIAAANKLAIAVKPLVDTVRGLPVEADIVRAFDAYAAVAIDSEITAAIRACDEPAPRTQRSGDVDVDEIVERSR